MPAYVALLYSIGLPEGRRLRTAEWIPVLEGLGLERPRTLFSTGNVVFEAGRLSVPALEKRLEHAYEAAFGRRVDHIVRTAATFRTLVAANPFSAETADDPAHVAVRVMRRPLADADLARFAERASPREKVAIVGGDLWLYAPEPPGKSRLIPMLSRERAGIGTIRVWNTIRRLGEMLDE